jgi:hypothetical protein
MPATVKNQDKGSEGKAPVPVRSITVIGRRWFSRGKGSTYYSADILVNGEHWGRIPYGDGYGEQYVSDAFAALEAAGIVSGGGGAGVPWQYCRDNGIALVTSVTEVTRRKDL